MIESYSEFIKILAKHPYLKTTLLSLLLILAFLVIKRVLLFQLKNKKMPRGEKVELQKKISKYFNYLLIPLMFFLWFSHLQVVMVSLVAVAAAIVIAFKELIMCIVGGLYLKSSKIFKTGDRIEINNIRGFVIETFVTSTKLLEIGPERNSQQTTGEVIGIPNSLFLSHTVKNESYFNGYSIKTFQFLFKIEEAVEEIEENLLSEAQDICSDYLEEASKSISKFCDKEGIVIPSVKARTKIVFDDHEVVRLLVKLVVRNSQVADVEQRLNRYILRWRKDKVLSQS